MYNFLKNSKPMELLETNIFLISLSIEKFETNGATVRYLTFCGNYKNSAILKNHCAASFQAEHTNFNSFPQAPLASPSAKLKVKKRKLRRNKRR